MHFVSTVFLNERTLLTRFWFLTFVGHNLVAYAQDDDEELVDVEEADAIVKDEAATEGEEDTGLKASPDAETRILFVNPVLVPGNTLGEFIFSKPPSHLWLVFVMTKPVFYLIPQASIFINK